MQELAVVLVMLRIYYATAVCRWLPAALREAQRAGI